MVAADTNFITNQVSSGAVAGCTVREDARASGVFPNPFSDAGDDMWFYHQFFASVIDDRGTDSDLLMSQNYPVDSKAQRKVADGDSIVFVGQGGGESDGFDVALFVRVLLKLH